MRGNEEKKNLLSRDGLIQSEKNYANLSDPNAPTKVEETPWMSIWLMALTTFLQSLGFSIVLPSLWFYLQFLEPEVPYRYLGYVVASYSIGQLIFSPVFGWWSDRASLVMVVSVSLIISMAANAVYALAPALLPNKEAALMLVMVSRFFVGVGAANIGVCRSYSSHATPLKDRTQAMALLSAGQGVGFAIGPAIGAVCVVVAPTNPELALMVNSYTSPGYLFALLSLINVILLLVVPFKEIEHHDDEEDEDDIPSTVSGMHEEGKSQDRPSSIWRWFVSDIDPVRAEEWTLIVVLNFLFYVVISVFSIFETMVTPLFQDYYNCTATTQAGEHIAWYDHCIVQTGLLFTGASIIGVVAFVGCSIKSVLGLFDERHLMAWMGFLVMTISLLFMGEWPWNWSTGNQPPLWQFLIGAVLMSWSYPVATVMSLALFSKCIHPKRQGTKTGWLMSTGSVARIIGPLWAPSLYAIASGSDHAWGKGGMIMFVVVALTSFSACVVTVLFYTRLVPHPVNVMLNARAERAAKLVA
eukprot:TRINITY_DN15024_c0_g1_i1.p1 TRINITY_DN15024_c0_g1~~TRINITY_DN15024_c0_g1_i1.p1  ORF type:complete len:585 (+),score=123.95 TRINITY_DN15024_c0_g1_i1:178-1755(+)